MSYILVEFIIGFFFLGIASVYDMRTREVPYWVSISFLSTAICTRIIYSIVTSSYVPILHGFYGFLVLGFIGYILFKFNIWGGADFTILTGVGCLMGFELYNPLSFNFLTNLFFFGGIVGMFYSIYLGLKKSKQLNYVLPKYMNSIYIISTIILLIGLLSFKRNLLIPFLLFAILIPLIVLFIDYIKQVETKLMTVNVKIPELTEGDWIVKDISYKNKIIAKKKEYGLSKQELKKLNELYKDKKITKVWIKIGMPFIPNFLIAFIITYSFGNILFLFL